MQPELKKRLESLSNYCPAVFAVKLDGIIVYVDAGMEEMFGYAKEDLTGLMLDVLVPESVKQRIPYMVEQFYTSGQTVGLLGIEEVKLEVVHAEGHEFLIDAYIAPTCGRVVFVLASPGENVDYLSRLEMALLAGVRRYDVLSSKIEAMVEHKGNLSDLSKQVASLQAELRHRSRWMWRLRKRPPEAFSVATELNTPVRRSSKENGG